MRYTEKACHQQSVTENVGKSFSVELIQGSTRFAEINSPVETMLSDCNSNKRNRKDDYNSFLSVEEVRDTCLSKSDKQDQKKNRK